MENYVTYLLAIGRIVLASVFLLCGLAKTGADAPMLCYMQVYDLPPALLVPTMIFEVGAGLALIAGCQARIVALLLAAYTMTMALVFRTDFTSQIQLIMFLRSVYVTCGLLLLVRYGAGAFSIDNRIGRKAVTQ